MSLLLTLPRLIFFDGLAEWLFPIQKINDTQFEIQIKIFLEDHRGKTNALVYNFQF